MDARSKSYGVLVGMADESGYHLNTAGYSLRNARSQSAVTMMEQLRERHPASSRMRYVEILQFDDFAHRKTQSVAFGRPKQGFELVELIMDPYFWAANGFADIRAAIPNLPDWHHRREVVFWRGVPSFVGPPDRDLFTIPRVRLALAAIDDNRMDVKLTGPWIHSQGFNAVKKRLAAARLLDTRVSMVSHAAFKYQIDIDGVSNAWSTLERLLLGSCVLKVGSDFEMWFYDRLVPWVHYVPIKADLSDLNSKLDWCLTNDASAREIADAGQRLAMTITYESAFQEAKMAFRRVRLNLSA